MRVRDIKISKKATNLTNQTNKTKTKQRQTFVLVFISS